MIAPISEGGRAVEALAEVTLAWPMIEKAVIERIETKAPWRTIVCWEKSRR